MDAWAYCAQVKSLRQTYLCISEGWVKVHAGKARENAGEAAHPTCLSDVV